MAKKIITKKEKGNDRHWKNFIDKKYLGSHNLEAGEEMLLTIEKFVGEEEVQGSDGVKSKKPVFYFKEQVPKMIMNATNGKTIEMLYGTQPEKWIGRQVLLYTIKGKWYGKESDGLRIRDIVPKRDIDIEARKLQLVECKTLPKLQDTWISFSASDRENKDLIAVKDELKIQLTKTK